MYPPSVKYLEGFLKILIESNGNANNFLMVV